VSLADSQPALEIADFQLRVLSEAIECSSFRFVMMIDEELRLRRTFEYSMLDRRPSLFDLIATAAKVRAGTARPALEGAPMRRNALRSNRRHASAPCLLVRCAPAPTEGCGSRESGVGQEH
jgi:hypothetical protein